MAEITAIVFSIVALLVSLVAALGGIPGVVAIGQHRREVEQSKWQDFQDSYRDQIALAEKRGDTEEANRLRREFEGQLEAWRAAQEIEGLAPLTISMEGIPSLSQEEMKRLKELLAASELLSPAALSAEDLLKRGNALYEAGEYEQATTAYTRALERKPDYPEAHYNRGVALGRLNRREEALAAFDRALALRPDYPEAHNNRGNALGTLDRYEEALAAYDRALALRPDYPVAHGNQGIALIWLGRYEEALKALDRALALRPDYATAMYNKACAYSRLEDGEAALEWLARAIEGDEKDRAEARTEEDFAFLREHSEYGPLFRELVGEEG